MISNIIQSTRIREIYIAFSSFFSCLFDINPYIIPISISIWCTITHRKCFLIDCRLNTRMYLPEKG